MSETAGDSTRTARPQDGPNDGTSDGTGDASRTDDAGRGVAEAPEPPSGGPEPARTATPAGAGAPADHGGHGRRREQRGWYFYDWANSAFSTTVLTVFLGPYLSTIAKAAADAHGYVHPLGLDVRAKAVFPFAVTVSVIAQVLLLPVTGAFIDHTGRKRGTLALFAYLGAFATIGLYFAAGGRYLLVAGLFIVANIAMGCSDVAYNSFLPDIAGPDERDAVSARGWGFGYLGGGLLLALNLVLYLGHDTFGLSQGMAVRISLASAGVWWAGFTLVPLRRLPHGHRTRTGETAFGAVRAGFAQLGTTLRDLRNRPVTLVFLLAFLIYNDGVQTVITLSATYATEELDLGQSVVIAAVLLVQFVAFGGALLLGRLAARHGTKRVVLASLLAWTVVVLVSYTLQRGSAVQFFLLAVVIGTVMGGTQALSRSLFSHLVPRERTAEYFGFYEISDKGTSWLGPFVFALALQLTDSYRSAIVSLVVFFVAGFVLLVTVDLPRGIREAGNPLPRRV
jgi:UMF1 family MFS transporter